MKKSFAVGVATAALLTTCSTAALAAPSVVVDSQSLALDQPPVIVNSRTLVPMRAIFEALGCEVSWYTDTQAVVAQKDLQSISLTVGDDTLYLNNKKIKLDVPAQIVNGHTMVPLRAISEALHATVAWDADTETVIVQGAGQGVYSYQTESYTKNENNISLDMAYPQFTVTSSNQTVLTELNSQLAAAALSRATTIAQEFSKLLEEASPASFTCTAQERYAITYNQKDYVSILFQTVQDTHGAHPMSVRNSTIYDMNTGKALALTDILKGDQQAIDSLILDGFTAQIQAQPDAFYPDAEGYLAKAVANHSYSYYLDENGLTFYFQLYEIAPYAAGFSEYTLPFSSDAFQLKF